MQAGITVDGEESVPTPRQSSTYVPRPSSNLLSTSRTIQKKSGKGKFQIDNFLKTLPHSLSDETMVVSNKQIRTMEEKEYKIKGHIRKLEYRIREQVSKLRSLNDDLLNTQNARKKIQKTLKLSAMKKFPNNTIDIEGEDVQECELNMGNLSLDSESD